MKLLEIFTSTLVYLNRGIISPVSTIQISCPLNIIGIIYGHIIIPPNCVDSKSHLEIMLIQVYQLRSVACILDRET